MVLVASPEPSLAPSTRGTPRLCERHRLRPITGCIASCHAVLLLVIKDIHAVMLAAYQTCLLPAEPQGLLYQSSRETCLPYLCAGGVSQMGDVGNWPLLITYFVPDLRAAVDPSSGE